MNTFLQIFFWSAIFIVFYAFLGYGILLYLIVKLKRIFTSSQPVIELGFEPEVAFVVPCYNEESFVIEKIKNTLALDYPSEKFKIYFITDGSTDGTPGLVSQFEGIQLLHEIKRGGKTAAENRVMNFITAPIVIFCDANTLLPPEAIKELVKHYIDPKVGGVSGEKRIIASDKTAAAGAGEGIYWKYESFLKRYDSELLTIVGAAGELFSFRKELFSPLEEDSILDDFMLSMRIAAKGYRIIYEPKAYAMETSSESVKEELKRKIRICAGGWQSMMRLLPVLNFFKHPVLTFEYVSHRVLRWSIAPICLFLLLPLNLLLCLGASPFYCLILFTQVLFYATALLGWYFQNRAIKIKIFFIPYYFFIMNLCVILGFFRYIKGSQSAIWEKAKRG